MQHDFSAYTVESLEYVKAGLYGMKVYSVLNGDTVDNQDEEHRSLLTDLISMLSEAKTKSLAFRKGIEDKMDTLKIEANY